MARHLEALSLRLYRTLEDVGLSEDMRKVHRQNVTAEILNTVIIRLKGLEAEAYQFGSFSEGTTTADMGSDVDLLSCNTSITVVADARDAVGPECQLMIWDGPTFNGYVKLQRVINGVPMTVQQMEADERFEPDSLGRMCWIHWTNPNQSRHGPADEIPVPGSDKPFDAVNCFKCENVPDGAKLWLRRPRKFGWPSRKCVNHMSTLPCFLVRVGHPLSGESEIEWRVSYSLHERELMFSLNTVQHQCYGFMKMVKKNIIEPAVGEECISSFHCKTVLFWAIENTPAELWLPNNTIQCIFTCFLYLKYFQFLNKCPNFFNPASNLFEREVFDRKKDRITEIINWILSNFLEMITQITCSNVGDIYMSGLVPDHISGAIIEQKSKCCMSVITSTHLLNNLFINIVQICDSYCSRSAMLYELLDTYTSVRNITEHTEEETEEARQFLLPILHFGLALCEAAESFRVRNGPLRYQLLRRSVNHTYASQGCDLMASRLFHLTISYRLCQYKQCEMLIQQMNRDLKSYVLSYCFCPLAPHLIRGLQLSQSLKISNTHVRYILASETVKCINFPLSQSEIIPEPLWSMQQHGRKCSILYSDDMSAEHMLGNDIFSVDGKVYFFLMQYLVYLQFNEHKKAEAARDSIRWLINNDLGLGHKDIAYNILAWIYLQERNHREAIQCWNISFEIHPLTILPYYTL